jgi:hypothetical protein
MLRSSKMTIVKFYIKDNPGVNYKRFNSFNEAIAFKNALMLDEKCESVYIEKGVK